MVQLPGMYVLRKPDVAVHECLIENFRECWDIHKFGSILLREDFPLCGTYVCICAIISDLYMQ